MEVNVFPVTDLAALRFVYRLHRIRGLSPEQAEYYRNVQILTRRLSSQLRSPAVVIVRNSEPYLVLMEDAPEPPSPFQLVCATAYFETAGETLTLDFGHRDPQTDPICLRFLQSTIERALQTRTDLWHPAAGQPPYMRRPVFSQNSVDVYRGFSVRAFITESRGIGLCVDAKHRYVSSRPLARSLSRAAFRSLRGTNCVYHWGNSWYDIKLTDHSGLTAGEYLVKGKPLLDYVTSVAPKPLPREVADLHGDSAALIYQTAKDEKRAAPSELCYPVFDTEDPRIRHLHYLSILKPHIRLAEIQDFVRTHLGTVRFGRIAFGVGAEPLNMPSQGFMPPDLEFGHGVVLSVRGTAGADHVALQEFGRRRLAALLDPQTGPYATKPLDRQYLIWPSSVADSYGQQFLRELQQAVKDVYPCDPPYDPITIPFNDHTERTFSAQGRAILRDVDAVNPQPGYGIVMLHETEGSARQREDELASMVMRELRKRSLFVSVIHTTVPGNSFVMCPKGPGPASYEPTSDVPMRRRFRGYLRNVALSKILITNERWPFVLAGQLHADMTVCIDVKLHTACFALVDKAGSDISTRCEVSNQKEDLGAAKAKSILKDLLHTEWELGRQGIQTLVIQRDGRFSIDELKGLDAAVADLKRDGSLPSTSSLTLVEIPKSSQASLRLFDVTRSPSRPPFVLDPQVGSYFCPSDGEGYICTTGRPYSSQGTANPLHVRRVAGSMTIEQILEDVYSLSCLAWTRPEGFCRDPVTVKLVDIRLREHAGEYDIDALKYGDGSEVEDGNE